MTVQNHYFMALPQSARKHVLRAPASLLILCLLSFVLLTPCVSAVRSEVHIVDDIKIDGTIAETLAIQLTNNTQRLFQFKPPIDATNLRLYGRALTMENGSLPIPLDCVTCAISISYELPHAAVAHGDIMEFSRTLDLPGNPELLDYQVVLPQGYRINAIPGEIPVVPAPTSYETDGEEIIVRWEQTNPAFPQRYYLSYAPPDEENFSLTTSWTELREWPVILFCVLMLFVGFASGWFFWGRRKTVPLSTIPASLLTPDERRMMAVLQVKKKIMQKTLGKELVWSKSKVSAIVTNLEQKRLLSREKIGRNYEVTLLQKVAE